MTKTVTVIGAGIIGVVTSIALRKKGFDVVVIESQHGVNHKCASYGNAGGLAFSEIVPMTSRNIMLKAPKWLLDPLGPLSISATHFPKLVPWFWHFWQAGKQTNVNQSVQALSSLNQLSKDLTDELYQSANIHQHIRPVGALHLYESEYEFNDAQSGWALRQQYGINFQHINRRELKEIEPAISTHFHKATLIEDWSLVHDPYKILQSLIDYASQIGVQFYNGCVLKVIQDSRINTIIDPNKNLSSDFLVIAAGAWSKIFACMFGDKIPVEAERGYNTTLPNPNVSIKRELIFGKHGFVASPLECGLRIGGAAEFSDVNAPANYKRSQAMLAKAHKFIPGLNVSGAEQWMGPRSSMPDSLPVISHAGKDKRIVYAFGHGHLGLTQAPATAALVTDLITGSLSAIDIQPFRATRFT